MEYLQQLVETYLCNRITLFKKDLKSLKWLLVNKNNKELKKKKRKDINGKELDLVSTLSSYQTRKRQTYGNRNEKNQV